MDDDPCPVHPDYDGLGDPPDPECADCVRLQEAVSASG
jgi:hypothetical protein